MKKSIRYLSGATVMLVLLFLLAVFLVPQSYQDTLTRLANREINKNIEGEIHFQDVSISLIRHFPNLSLGLHALKISGNTEHVNDSVSLLTAKRLDLVLDLISVIRRSKPVRLVAVTLEKPKLNICIPESGKANYDIFIAGEQEEDPKSGDFLVDIDKYILNDALIRVSDQNSGFRFFVEGLQHTGRLNYRGNLIGLNMDMASQHVDFGIGQVTYLDAADLDVKTDLSIDLDKNRYTFDNNAIVLNALRLALSGSLDLNPDGQSFDLALRAPGNAFKDFLSLLPNAYTDQFEAVSASGDLGFEASLKGQYNAAAGVYPTYSVRLEVHDGRFRYPGKDLEAKDIQINAQISNHSNRLLPGLISIRKLHADLGGNPVDARLEISDPGDKPKVDGRIGGSIDLEKLHAMYPFPGVESMRGMIVPDIEVDFAVSDIERGVYENIVASGDLRLDHCLIRLQDKKEYQIRRIAVTFDHTTAIIEDMDLGTQNSNLSAQGRVEGLQALYNPSESLTVSGHVESDIQIRDIADFLSPGFLEKMQGQVDADLDFVARFPDLRAGRYDKLDLSGSLQARDCVFEIKNLPRLVLQDLNASFSPNRMHFTKFDLEYRNSKIAGNVVLDQLTAMIDDGDILQIEGSLDGGVIDLNPFLEQEGPDDTDAVEESSVPELVRRVRFDIAMEADSLIYETYRFADVSARVTGTPDQLRINRGHGRINGSHVGLNGALTGIPGYTWSGGDLRGNLSTQIDILYVDRWMQAPETTEVQGASETPAYVRIPDQIDIALDLKSDEIHYGDIVLQDAKGSLALVQNALALRNFKARGLGGQLSFAGLYDTTDPLRPAFNFKYDLNGLNFGKVFSQVVTFRQIAPIAAFMEGVFNSTLVMEGRLGENGMPDLKTLSASGLIEILNARFEDCPLLQQADQAMKTDFLRNLVLEKSRNKFRIQNGTVAVEPFPVKMGDIEMAIGGRHQIRGTMQYEIDMKIPKEMLVKNPAGKALDQGMASLRSALASKGVAIRDVDHVQAGLMMTGTLKDPSFSFGLRGTGSAGGDGSVVEKAAAEITKQLEDTLIKTQEKRVSEVRDTISKIAGQVVDSVKSAIGSEARKAGDQRIDEVLKTIGDKLDQSVSDSSGTGLQNLLKEKGIPGRDSAGKPDIEKVLKDWNPFKKKKKKEE